MITTKRKVVSILTCVGLCLIGLGVIFTVRHFSRRVAEQILQIASPTPTPDPLAPINVLLLGHGGAGHDGGLVIAKDVIAEVTGLPIRYAVAIDFSGFTTLIHTLGGIFVDVPFAFTDTQYPITGKETDTCGVKEEDIQAITATMSGTLLAEQFPCRYETITFEKGKQFMNEETALKFVRSRHSGVNGGDFGRSRRQQAFLLGVKNKLFSFSSALKIIPLIRDSLSMITTDLTMSDLTTMMDVYGDSSAYIVHSMALTDENVLAITTSADRQYILVPKTGDGDWNSIRQYIQTEIVKYEASSSAVLQ